MKTTDYTGVEKAQLVAKGLQELLADLQISYTNLRGMHWNIKGKNFYGLHARFEAFYNVTSEQIDEVAERILMLGEVPEHNFSQYLKTTKVAETGIISDAEKAIKEILNTLKLLIAKEREVISIASELGDEATVSMLSDYISAQEKDVWMLVAFIS